MMPSVPQIIVLLLILFLFVLPPVLVIASKRASGGARYGWFLAAVVLSWLGYLAFILVTKSPEAIDQSQDRLSD